MQKRSDNRIYGARPVDLGLVGLSPVEMMFWQDLPIKLAGRREVILPPNLVQFHPIIWEVQGAVGRGLWDDHNVYLSAKTMYVSPSTPMNRPGWHSDGFMSDDHNFIWSTSFPTEFWVPDRPVAIVQDHVRSLEQMENMVLPEEIVTYPDRHLLWLTESVIHRVAPVTRSGMRSFVKVSLSKSFYNRVGNSINHALPLPVAYAPRSLERNCPIAA